MEINSPLPVSRRSARCGIVLSAGDGTRLQEFVRQRRGDALPKQYNAFTGRRSMLEHTLDRAAGLIPPQNLFVVVAREHLKFREVHRQLATRSAHRLITQPANRETGPGILLPLLHIHRRDPEAVVSLFPSDHFILEENIFMAHVEQAFRVVEDDPRRLVLLGLSPREPDPQYGYIVPAKNSTRSQKARPVGRFVEKPSLKTAKKLIDEGGLWNTMVMVFSCSTMLSIIESIAPVLHRSFAAIRDAIGTADERRVIAEAYRAMPALNFSTGILEALPKTQRRTLLVLPVRGVTWSDWGTRERVAAMLRLLSRARVGPAVRPARRPLEVSIDGWQRAL